LADWALATSGPRFADGGQKATTDASGRLPETGKPLFNAVVERKTKCTIAQFDLSRNRAIPYR